MTIKRVAIKSTVAEIVAYWAPRESECGLSVDWAEAHERCWRCSRKTSLERCHIVPHSRGGLDTPDNLILLCSRCHREAPNVSDPSFIWTWLRRYAASFYDTDWINRGFEEFERIFSRKPFANLNDDIPEDRIRTALKKRFEMITVHFGEGRPNPTTVAWLLSELEKELAKQSSKIHGD
jgi:hypothetical protein